jgi:ectoine hydroxylase-related dioxygenase (phytanoyl-CoA dioxygenase family)
MNEEGFIHLKSIFTTHDLRKALSDQSILSQDRVSFAEDHKYTKLLKHPQIKKAISDMLFTTDYHLTTLSSNTLFNDKDTRGYHVDFPYHKYNTDANDMNLIYSDKTLDSVQCIIPLDNFTIENGATMYVPYSYLARRYPTVEILQSGKFTTVPSTNENEENEIVKTYDCKKKYFLGNVGDVIIYPSTLWHSSGLNTTNTPRRALLANFSPRSVPKKDY